MVDVEAMLGSDQRGLDLVLEVERALLILTGDQA